MTGPDGQLHHDLPPLPSADVRPPSYEEELAVQRAVIDEVDLELVALINRRAAAAWKMWPPFWNAK